MKFMAKQATHKVGSTKLRNGCHPQSARLCMNYTIHFPHRSSINQSADGQGQLNLGA
jgi:hypothetical protein